MPRKTIRFAKIHKIPPSDFIHAKLNVALGIKSKCTSLPIPRPFAKSMPEKKIGEVINKQFLAIKSGPMN